MAATLSVAHDPFSDGLGKGSNVGVAFLRKVTVTYAGGTTTKEIVPSDVGATGFYGVLSLVPQAALMAPIVSSFAEDAVSVDVGANGVCDVYLLCKGM